LCIFCLNSGERGTFGLHEVLVVELGGEGTLGLHEVLVVVHFLPEFGGEGDLRPP